MTTTEACKFCPLPQADHGPGKTVHPFTPEGSPGRLPSPKDRHRRDHQAQGQTSSDQGANRSASQSRAIMRSGEGVDLALRVALMRAGVISREQLDAAEADIRRGGIIFVEPPDQSTSDGVHPELGSGGGPEGSLRGNGGTGGDLPSTPAREPS